MKEYNGKSSNHIFSESFEYIPDDWEQKKFSLREKHKIYNVASGGKAYRILLEIFCLIFFAIGCKLSAIMISSGRIPVILSESEGEFKVFVIIVFLAACLVFSSIGLCSLWCVAIKILAGRVEAIDCTMIGYEIHRVEEASGSGGGEAIFYHPLLEYKNRIYQSYNLDVPWSFCKKDIERKSVAVVRIKNWTNKRYVYGIIDRK